MVRVNHPDGDYCIDRTEVTKGQYKEFFEDMEGNFSGQRPECSGNVTYDPRWCGSTYYIDDNLNFPVACVDWCDADAFCRWSGKRLCGRIGGGELQRDLAPNPEGEWYNACTAAGEFQPEGTCGADGSLGYARTVEVSAGCLGSAPPFDEVSYLVGNVAEWTAECGRPLLGSVDECIVNGGSFQDHFENPSRYVCTTKESYPRTYRRNIIGIRCCAEVTP
ncbi:MAG: SUMF1/EgtB/PvdO family nonheme iron enzyme [Polyangiaceae bacterium]|nr:SUMF1/EgtB/PvdO family nonheme iron enzyme [Polyangiaceae bacterium]MCW5789148.1 SUMF1/EgtB/PvdO family nonheme iron enzyme [Polyangiaceae bacterium]